MPLKAAPSLKSAMRLILAKILAVAALAGAPALAETFPSSAGDLAVDTVAGGLVHPWSLAFLPDGRMLVTERPGRMRIVTRGGALSPPLAGVPEVYAQSQAGLMDVMLDRDYAQNRTIYLLLRRTYDGGGRIAVARARLDDGRTPRLDGSRGHFPPAGPAVARPQHRLPHRAGARTAICSSRSATISPTRSWRRTLDNHIGKIMRITPDGNAPPDNPFVGKPGALPEIWAYGLRNAEGLAFNPADGKLWEQEHGPMGGDEINIIAEGQELRLAGGQLRRQLRRHAGRHRQATRATA